ncbi:TPA: hypothetical protein P1K40_000318 [Clostridioides difficile]|nr:hypothetical protein [Clostridioides difficile]
MNLLSSRIFKRKNRNKNIKKRSLSAFLAFVMMLGVIPLRVYSATDGISEVKLEDENLKIAVQEEIKKINPDYTKNTITNKDMELLTELNLSNKGIKSLSGIESAVNLKSISLDGNEITDIRALGLLSKLEKYNISNQTINLDLGSVDKSKIEFENMLVNTNGSKITSLSGDDISLNEEKVVISNLIDGENKKIVSFNTSTKKGQFSGKIEINVISELKEEGKEDLKQLEVEKNTEENSKITKAQLRPDPNSNIELNDSFIVSSFRSQESHLLGEDNSEYISKNISKNYIKATEEGQGHYQNTSITSKNKINFDKSFNIKGKINQSGFHFADGIVFAFHNQEGYKFKGGYSSNLGVYDYNGSGLKQSALVVEVDAWGNFDRDEGKPFGDQGMNYPDVHLGINRIIPNNYPEVLAIKPLDRKLGLFTGIQDFNISWDAINKTIKLQFAGYEIEKKIENIEEVLGGQEAYYTIGTAAGKVDEGATTEVLYDSFNYTDFDIDNRIEYYAEREGKEISLSSNDNIKEEDTIIVKHKFYNKYNSSVYKSKLILTDNNFRGKVLSIKASNDSSWYTPYIIKDSFKTYVGDNKIDDDSIDADAFFSGNYANVDIPANRQVRTIEYKIKMPKVLGESVIKLEQSSKIGMPGMEYFECIDSRNAIGVKAESIKDINLKNGLITNITSKITEKKPTELDDKIYQKELEVLDIINLSNLRISDLSGLEKCTNAVEINLSSNNDITDVSVLSKISKLKSLNLSNNTKILKDSLGQLLNLDTLLMNNANIDDEYTDEIGKLTNLKKLSLKNNKISNLNNLSSLKFLNEFYFDNNKIYDLRPIKDQIENAKLNANKYSIKKQVVNIERPYINSGEFIFDNIIYNSKAIENNISGADGYDFANDRVKWVNLPDGVQDISYNWMNNQFMFSGTVNIELNQVPGPDYLVVIPSSLKMGDVLDENSVDYDEEIDKTSINYKPDKDVIKPNPTVYGMAGAKDIISISSDDTIIGNVNIYSDSAFTMTNTNNSKDMSLVDVYKTFNDKLSGTASSKKDKLMSLNNTNRKDTFRIKAPTSRFKYNNVEYTGTMNFIIEHVK